jgi:tetratricopeptide (TPR) repeat protein
MADIDLEHIFIPRKKQMLTIDAAIGTWQYHIAALTQQNNIASEQYRCIIGLSGNSGLGKSTLLKQCREELLSSETPLLVGKIIDWFYVLNDASRLRFFMVNDVYEIPYFEMMHAQLAASINQRLNDFKEYKKRIALIRDVEEKVRNISRGVQKIVECDALWKISGVRMLKLLQWFARSGSYEEDIGVIRRKIREYAGDSANIDIACVSYLYEELSRKLGESFNDYLHADLGIATAFGHDLRQFARKRPLLILFDSYECIEKGTHLLRSVIEAAGTRVGWIITGRSQEWINSNSFLYNNEKVIKQKAEYSASIVHILLQAEGSGSFSTEEITKYFAQIRKQKPSLRAIKKSDAQKIHAITRGIPLAVSLAAQIYTQTGRLDTLLEKGEGARDIVEGMVERYLFYVPYNRRERIILYGIAMQRRMIDGRSIDQVAVNSMSSMPLLKEQLHITHTVFFERDQIVLHQEIRHFLRRWLLEHWNDAACKEAAAQLQAQLQMRIDNIEKRYPDQRIDQRFEDDIWVNAYLDLIEAQFWVDESHGFSYCLPFLLASIIYQPNLLVEAIAIGNSFRNSMTAFYSKQWDCVVLGLQNSDSLTTGETEKNLEKIEQLLASIEQNFPVPFAEWRRELQGALYWKRAELYQKQDRNKAAYWYQKAIHNIEHSAKLREEAAYVHWMLALDYDNNRQYKRSLEELEEALTIKFDFADVHSSKGNIYCKIGEYNRAITEYLYAIVLDDHYISAHINLGNTYLSVKRYRDAVDQYSKTLSLGADSVALYYNRACAYTLMGLYEEALADYSQTIELQPELAEAYTNRGTVYAHLRKYENALADYNAGCMLIPQNIQSAWMALWANLEDFETLERSKVEALIDLEPDHYLSHVCRSILLALQCSESEVILEEMELAIQGEPEEYDHYFWQGMILAYQQDTLKARDAFEKALATGLPPLLLKPLYWLKPVTPQFFETYAIPLLTSADL